MQLCLIATGKCHGKSHTHTHTHIIRILYHTNDCTISVGQVELQSNRISWIPPMPDAFEKFAPRTSEPSNTPLCVCVCMSGAVSQSYSITATNKRQRSPNTHSLARHKHIQASTYDASELTETGQSKRPNNKVYCRIGFRIKSLAVSCTC